MKYFKITCPIGTFDDHMFYKIINSKGFSLSRHSIQNNRRVLNFHAKELPLLLEQLRNHTTEYYHSWADDIERLI